MPTTLCREKLKLDRPLVGTFLQIPAAEMAESVGHAGLDFVIFR
jgi:2-keto-3-deoxy-L-rhamnonate aldolase RhmA